MEQVVLEHYHTLGDTFKLRAAEFLLSNMSADKFSYTGVLIEQYDTLFRFQRRLLEAGTLNASHARLDSMWKALEKEHGPFNIRRLTVLPDSTNLSAQLLIDNIDQAVDAWKRSPLYDPQAFDLFCEHLLPYRVRYEPVEPFRERYRREYGALLDSAKSLKELANRLTRRQRGEGYDTLRFMRSYPIDIPISKLDLVQRGSCDHIAILTTLILRACGYPATMDRAVWGNRRSGQTWNVLLSPNGEEFPFDVGRDSLEQTYRPAKVWRTTFSGHVDVTEKYASVYDLALPVDYPSDSYRDRQKASLCTFDHKNWRPVAQGEVRNDTLHVARVAADLVYLPAFVNNNRIIPCGAPFILHTDGRIVPLKNDDQRKQNIILSRKYLSGDCYELLYWNSFSWRSLGIRVAEYDDRLTYDNVPTGGLYLLHHLDNDTEERIFTYEKGKQRWW
jgi:hypothetical protein